MSSNLPPGVRDSDIPGNRPEDLERETRKAKFHDGVVRAIQLVASRLGEETVENAVTDDLDRSSWTEVVDDDEFAGFSIAMETLSNVFEVEMPAYFDNESTEAPPDPAVEVSGRGNDDVDP